MDKVKTLLSQYLNMESETVGIYISILIKVILIFLLARLVIFVLNRIIENIFKLYPKLRKDTRKTNTLTGILKSVVKYTVYIVMAISILEALNIPTQPLLATAGLGGLAIGFGAQSLVRDVFTGFFILFEDQYSVGDYVTINGITGTVEDMGLRITKIRSFKGELNIIPNGEVKIVTNLSKGDSLAVVDVGVAYETTAEKAIEALKAIAERYYGQNKEDLVDKPEVLGLTSFGESDVIIRLIAKTRTLQHWKVERELRKMILAEFKERGIEIPYPRRVMIENNK